MKAIWLCTITVAAIALSCAFAHGSMLTFEEVPGGTSLLQSDFYNDSYHVWFASPFEAADHADSAWGPPHSGSNVLAWASSGEGVALGGRITFGLVSPGDVDPDSVASVGAYFSTRDGAMINVSAYRLDPSDNLVLVTSRVIGASGQQWDNQYVELSSEGPFDRLRFEGVNSSNELLSFCLDDMTITYVPEPSSLLALCSGLVGAGAMWRRRR